MDSATVVLFVILGMFVISVAAFGLLVRGFVRVFGFTALAGILVLIWLW